MLYRNLFISLLVLVSSCALRKMPAGLTKYQQAMLQYEAKAYYAASQLLEEALPLLRGKQEEAAAYFCQAYCYFYQKKYIQSAGHFQHVHEKFLGDPRLEEAMYMQGHALYLRSPDVKLDATLTEDAISALRNYLNTYPQGKYTSKASVQLETLQDKLVTKAFNNAKLYYRLAYYRAAVVYLENFSRDFPNAPYQEEAAYLKAQAQYKFFRNTKEPDKKRQLGIALQYCKEFLDNYPNSSYTVTVETLYKNISSAK